MPRGGRASRHGPAEVEVVIFQARGLRHVFAKPIVQISTRLPGRLRLVARVGAELRVARGRLPGRARPGAVVGGLRQRAAAGGELGGLLLLGLHERRRVQGPQHRLPQLAHRPPHDHRLRRHRGDLAAHDGEPQNSVRGAFVDQRPCVAHDSVHLYDPVPGRHKAFWMLRIPLLNQAVAIHRNDWEKLTPMDDVHIQPQAATALLVQRDIVHARDIVAFATLPRNDICNLHVIALPPPAVCG
mmetsp:Transcript_95307/g.238880  ORF Transcript_95307/g.238880 Transcript_95307/m.238880 type:complete len:242 (+) Transcript_95307:780-1505(+)